MKRIAFLWPLLLLAFITDTCRTSAQHLPVTEDMVFNLTGLGHASYLFDGDGSTVFEPRHFADFVALPATIIVKMADGAATPCGISKIRFESASGAHGFIQVFSGEPGSGNWTPMSTDPVEFGNGVSALEWYPVLTEVKFLKFVFSDPNILTAAHFRTGDIYIQSTGDCAFSEPWTDCSQGGSGCPERLPFDQFMGVNNFIGKTQLQYQAGPFGCVREYLPWDHVQGHISAGNASPNFEDQEFRFAPCFPGYDLDRHYKNLADLGKSVLGTFKESSPFQMRFDYQQGQNDQTMNQMGMSYGSLGQAYLDLMERKPGHPTDGVRPNSSGFSDPATYSDHGKAIYQLSLRYGRDGNGQKAATGNSAAFHNQNILSFVENWNEQDKWWMQPWAPAPINADYERRLAFFTPQEYMAMTYADRALGGGELNLPLIMGGISEFDYEWIRGAYMAWWELTGANPAANFPFAAINLHHYSVDNWQKGLSPENDTQLDPNNTASDLNKIIRFRNAHLPDKKIWVTEFGYSDHPQDNTAATPHYANPDYEEVQAQWIVRTFLRYYKLGIERAFTYQLTDDGPNQWHGMFNHTGMIDRTDGGGGLPQYAYKKAWYYCYTLKNMLEKTVFTGSSTGIAADGRPVEIYQFTSETGDKNIRALWVPQDVNPGTTAFQLTVTPGATLQLVEMADGYIGGVTSPLADTDQDGWILVNGVGERPLFVVEGETQSPQTCHCSVNLQYATGSAAAATALTDDANGLDDNNHPKCQYGADCAHRWNAQAGETVTLNIGGGSTSDLWIVENLYLHDPAGSDGEVLIEFLNEAGMAVKAMEVTMDQQAVYPFNATGTQYNWRRWENLSLEAASIRLTALTPVSIGELLLCGKNGVNTCAADYLPPASAGNISVTQENDGLSATWPLSGFAADLSYFSSKIVDLTGMPVSNTQYSGLGSVHFDLAQLACATTYYLEVTTHDCEGLTSAPVSIPFVTAACSTPPPTPDPGTGDCSCAPQPLSLTPADVYYELEAGQTLPASAWLGDPCADAQPDKGPWYMVDEQSAAVLGKICSSGYALCADGADYDNCTTTSGQYPVKEWFPGWPGGTAQYPYKAVLHFDTPMSFNGIFLYDSNDKGYLSIEYRLSSDDQWTQLELPGGKTHYTDHWRRWCQVFHTTNILTASDIRITMKDEHARFSEIAFCANPVVRKDGDIGYTPAATTGVGLANSDGLPRVFPNPASGLLTVMPQGMPFTEMVVTDVAGRQLMTVHNDETSDAYSLDVSDLNTGFYFLHFMAEGKVVWATKVGVE